MEGQFSQMSRLRKVVDYLLEGSDQLIVPQGIRGDHHLDVALRMSQSTTPIAREAQTKEARILYVPGCVRWKKFKVPYVVRRLIWNQGKDRERCRSRRVIFPDICDDYFKLVDSAHVMAAANSVEDTLNSMKSKLPVDLWFESQPEDDQAQDDQASTHKVATEPVYHRWIDLQTWPAQTKLLFSTSQMKPKFHKTGAKFNSAWEALWDALGATFVESNRLRRVMITRFDVPVKSYARALASIREHA